MASSIDNVLSNFLSGRLALVEASLRLLGLMLGWLELPRAVFWLVPSAFLRCPLGIFVSACVLLLTMSDYCIGFWCCESRNIYFCSFRRTNRCLKSTKQNLWPHVWAIVWLCVAGFVVLEKRDLKLVIRWVVQWGLCEWLLGTIVLASSSTS